MPATTSREITITLPRTAWTATAEGMTRAAHTLDGPGWCLHVRQYTAFDDEICPACAENLTVAQQLRDLAATITATIDGAVTLSAFDWSLIVAGLNQAASCTVDASGWDCIVRGAGRVCEGCRSGLRGAVQWCELAEQLAEEMAGQIVRPGRLVAAGGGIEANR